MVLLLFSAARYVAPHLAFSCPATGPPHPARVLWDTGCPIPWDGACSRNQREGEPGDPQCCHIQSDKGNTGRVGAQGSLLTSCGRHASCTALHYYTCIQRSEPNSTEDFSQFSGLQLSLDIRALWDASFPALRNFPCAVAKR